MKKIVLALLIAGGIFGASQTAQTGPLTCIDTGEKCCITYPDGTVIDSERGKTRGVLEIE